MTRALKQSALFLPSRNVWSPILNLCVARELKPAVSRSPPSSPRCSSTRISQAQYSSLANVLNRRGKSRIVKSLRRAARSKIRKSVYALSPARVFPDSNKTNESSSAAAATAICSISSKRRSAYQLVTNNIGFYDARNPLLHYAILYV